MSLEIEQCEAMVDDEGQIDCDPEQSMEYATVRTSLLSSFSDGGCRACQLSEVWFAFLLVGMHMTIQYSYRYLYCTNCGTSEYSVYVR